MKKIIGACLVVILLFGIEIGGVYLKKKQADTLFNNGICSICVTEFHLIDIEHNRNGIYHYFYACNNEHLIECPCQPSKNK